MKINSLYTLLINRFALNERIEAKSGKREALPSRIVQGDRSELSRLVAALKEMERLEEEPGHVQTERLNRLQEEINSGAHKLDLHKLAESMLYSDEL